MMSGHRKERFEAGKDDTVSYTRLRRETANARFTYYQLWDCFRNYP